MKLCISVPWYILIIKKIDPKNSPPPPPGGRHIYFQYGAKMTKVLPISPVLLHLGLQFKCLYRCFRCLGTFWQCQNLRQEAAILDFKMAAKCFTLFFISLIIALWKENKDSLHLGKCLLSGNCQHMAAVSQFKMATTLLDMQFSIIYRCRLPSQLSLRQLLYHHFA